MHVNANNLAILPHAVHKRHAVQFLLDNHLDHQRPSFGFGDSLADLPFCSCLTGTVCQAAVRCMSSISLSHLSNYLG
ncbi:hypothetical protein [Psychrobacter sp. KH172YL61]|uniref:hypothetical protein n=1 Tax=Psychrobacter sp. KH172YL61 TaxID=2517899 RepID=UPI002FCCBA67